MNKQILNIYLTSSINAELHILIRLHNYYLFIYVIQANWSVGNHTHEPTHKQITVFTYMNSYIRQSWNDNVFNRIMHTTVFASVYVCLYIIPQM